MMRSATTCGVSVEWLFSLAAGIYCGVDISVMSSLLLAVFWRNKYSSFSLSNSQRAAIVLVINSDVLNTSKHQSNTVGVKPITPSTPFIKYKKSTKPSHE